MVLRLKTRESRSLPGLQSATKTSKSSQSQTLRPKAKSKRPLKKRPFALNKPASCNKNAKSRYRNITNNAGQEQPSPLAGNIASGKGQNKKNGRVLATCSKDNAGWSSPVARQAHNLKAAGSNPAPATKSKPKYQKPARSNPAGFCAFGTRHSRSSNRQASLSSASLRLNLQPFLANIAAREKVLRSALVDDLTVAHHMHLVGNPQRYRQLMFHQEARQEQMTTEMIVLATGRLYASQ
jgi:hypothetical protein